MAGFFDWLHFNLKRIITGQGCVAVSVGVCVCEKEKERERDTHTHSGKIM